MNAIKYKQNNKQLQDVHYCSVMSPYSSLRHGVRAKAMQSNAIVSISVPILAYSKIILIPAAFMGRSKRKRSELSLEEKTSIDAQLQQNKSYS